MENIKFTALFSQIPRTQPNGQTKNSFQSLLKFVDSKATSWLVMVS